MARSQNETIVKLASDQINPKIHELSVDENDKSVASELTCRNGALQIYSSCG
jgi:hypothetical protein